MAHKSMDKPADAHMATVPVGFDTVPIRDKAMGPDSGEQIILGQGVYHHQHDAYPGDLLAVVDGATMPDGKAAVAAGPVGFTAGTDDDFSISRAAFKSEDEFLDAQLGRLRFIGTAKTRVAAADDSLLTANAAGVTDILWTDGKNLKGAKIGDRLYLDLPRSEEERRTRQTGVGSVKVPWVARIGSGRVTANRVLAAMRMVYETKLKTVSPSEPWDDAWVDDMNPVVGKAVVNAMKAIVKIAWMFTGGPPNVALVQQIFVRAATPGAVGATTIADAVAELVAASFDAVHEDEERYIGTLLSVPHALGDRVLVKLG